MMTALLAGDCSYPASKAEMICCDKLALFRRILHSVILVGFAQTSSSEKIWQRIFFPGIQSSMIGFSNHIRKCQKYGHNIGIDIRK
jgi:hypothetical protein